jgi:hypothetical protein
MHLPNFLVSALMLSSRGPQSETAETELVTRASNTTLQPWQITDLYTWSPSGRPGSSMWAYMGFTITDPNTIDAGPIAAPPFDASYPPSTANCSAEWQWYPSESPAGKVWRCTNTQYGPWTFELGEGATTEGFNLTVHRKEGMVNSLDTFTRTFVAKKEFAVGKNMRGTCGGSGVCSWGQSEPIVDIQPKQTNCTGTAGYC